MVLPLDMPDEYPWLPGSGRSQLGDLGELASRLGSIVTYDRRGSVYWFEDFENGIEGIFPQTSGVGAEVRLTHKYVFRGLLSAKLTGGSDSTLSAGILKRIAPALLTTYGLEATVSVESDVDFIRLGFQYNTGITRYNGAFYIDVTTQKLYYLSNAFTLVVIDSALIEDNDPTLFFTAKVVIDLVNNKYIRALFNQTEYDLTNIGIYSVADTTIPRIEASVFCFSVSGSNGIAYVDNIIVTVGDP